MTLGRGHPEAIVRPRAAEHAFTVERLVPREPLQEFVDYFWLVRWDVRGPYRQQVVPQPRVHLAAEQGRLLVHGVTRRPFFRTLTGRAHTLGAAFHPGGFRPFLSCSSSSYASAAQVAGAVLPAADLFGVDDRGPAGRILSGDDAAALVRTLEDYLERLGPRRDPAGNRVNDLVRLAEEDPAITRAEMLAARGDVGLRTLQRLFSEYVGIGPKWVVQRFRLLDAAAAAHSGGPVDWSGLADRLGFSDQSHLTRAFTQVVGTPPARYQRDL